MSLKNIRTTFSPLNVDPSKPFGSDDIPISKLKKSELELQIDVCHSYKEFKLLFFTFGSWQEPAFMPIFSLDNQAKVEERLDALTMALALKNHKRVRLQKQPSQDKIEPLSIQEACHVLTQLPCHPHMAPFTQTENFDTTDWFEHQCKESPTSVALRTEEDENIC